MAEAFHERVLQWFDRHGRKNLPWQRPATPYRVWLSEIMLQQTQVETVIPYFLRFTDRFPDVSALAQAPLDDVLHLWTGLGYYARARNLHRCAGEVMARHEGRFPADTAALQALPGIGRSTAAAIASLAFDQPAAILDGNVKRVLARHSATAGWPGSTDVARRLWEIAEARMPQSRCRDYTQAMMDLGATLCTRGRPDCPGCPIADDCQALALGRPRDFPGRRPAREKPTRELRVLLLESPSGEILLEQRPATGIWGGLWSLPELPLEADPLAAVQREWGDPESSEHWPPVPHSFTHFNCILHPTWVRLTRLREACREAPPSRWLQRQQASGVGLPAPIKRLLDAWHGLAQPILTPIPGPGGIEK